MAESQHRVEPTGVSTTETVVESPTQDSPAITSPTNTTACRSGTTSTSRTRFQVDEISQIPRESSPSNDSTTSSTLLPLYIPYSEELQGRTLVVCFDGTGDQFDADNSNIVQLVSMLKKDDKTKQMVYYQAGIGTYISPAVATPLTSKISKVFDEMLAWNLDSHVMGGYEFLMQNYIAGDKICIFGFSRGAYTAQSLAGMVHKVGLLPADNHQQIPFAYKMYTRTDSVGWDQSNAFKKAFSIDVRIEFLGVWDTVESVGLIPKRLPFTSSNTIVKTFRHAVALDERRAKFKANLWNRPTKEALQLGIDLRRRQYEFFKRQKGDKKKGDKTAEDEKAEDEKAENKQEEDDEHEKHGDGQQKKPKKLKLHRGTTLWKLDQDMDRKMNHYESIYSGTYATPTDVEEVWFAGCHCDVGGGSVANSTRYSLARIPLRWMVRECFKTKTGLLFNTECLRDIGLDPTTLHPSIAPRPPALFHRAKTQTVDKPPSTSFSRRVKNLFTSSKAKQRAAMEEAERRSNSQFSSFISEEDEELWDALSPKFDQLKLKRFWWALELLPISMRYQRGDNQWVSYIGINMGRQRFIPKQRSWGVKVHRSVKLRMEADGSKKYQPKAKLNVEPIWID
ncbi:hypothetical protein M378DRAFT_9939 [Amanita muscaria Koide BX008]|uniref:T6SS Phospholipase effector Tle1-like catalytic domain-containing protein n=1 Tax=Amanita muscaria (strain Koide BX008) TaxID=946122 RepID=A0A0C2XC44_AMAMK|nr:hypothetical protein M378DRAFT_9939 [Amanita muscaria Koide BX008]